jgi:AcrR family transcriptional regulator
MVYSQKMHDVKRRPYDSPLRRDQAAATRVRIAEAAAIEFADHGWAGTTVAAIAVRAGVTPQAIHLAVGGKAALLIRAVETAVAGSGDPAMLADRPAFVDVYSPGLSPDRRLRAFAAASADIYDRAARLFLVLQDAARADTEVARRAADGAARRLADHRRLAALLLPVAPSDTLTHLTDIIWVLAGPAVYVELVHNRQWSGQQYSDFLATDLRSAVRRLQ